MEIESCFRTQVTSSQGGWSVLNMALTYGETRGESKGLSVMVVAEEELPQTVHCGQEV